jgi:hypothetical protein
LRALVDVKNDFFHALYTRAALTLERFVYFVRTTGIGYPRVDELRRHLHMKLHAQVSMVFAIDHERLIRA